MSGYIVTGIRPKSEDDGSHLIEIATSDASITAVIPAAFVQELLRVLQGAVIRRIFDMSQRIDQPVTESLDHLPEWTVTTAHKAHRGQTTNLSIATVQVGTFVLAGSDQAFRQMRNEIDSLLKNRASSHRIN